MAAVPLIAVAVTVAIGLHRDAQRRAQWIHDECTVIAMREAIGIYYGTHGTYPAHPGDLARCPSLTQTEEQALAQVRQMVAETARVYQVSPPAVAVVEISGMVASYRPDLVLLHPPALTALDRDVVVAHEMAHALLGHAARRGDARAPLDDEDERLEALRGVYERLWRQQRAVAAGRPRPAPGHRGPCEEIEDLLRRFPQHRAWTAQLECALGVDSR